ncbi:MAG: ARMT1-like domain-containing protein [Candidatus Omnitrophota bacterium]
MKTYLECIPCFLRQALDAAKLSGADKKTQKKIIDEVARLLPDFSLDVAPPEIARTVYGVVENYTGGKDAYRHIKEKSNAMAMELYARLKKEIEGSDDILLSAVRLAVAGNVIDYGVPHAFDIEKEIEECLEKDFAVFDFDDFKKAVNEAKNILYILDNAGEIVFDTILIEEIKKDIICAVRGKPIINDVTMEDARQVGLDKKARVISSGSDIPGTGLERCDKEFLQIYKDADVIISKGQGNYETLADEARPIFFIFKAKCPVIAEHIGCRVGDIILKKQSSASVI